MPIGFVDRVEHMEELGSVLAALAEGRGGRAVAFDSVSGMGKSALLRAFEAEAATAPGPTRCRIVSTRCQPGIGPDLMYGPVLDLLLKLGEDQEPKRRGVFRRMLGATGKGVVRSAPEVLSAVVPGLGAVFTLGRDITEASLDSGSMPFDSLLPFRHAAALRIVEGLLDVVRQGPPVVLVIDDVQHIDESSQFVLDLLLRRLPQEPVAVVLSHTSDGAYADGRESKVESLLHSWAGEGLLRRRTMRGLPQDAIAELVAQRHPAAPPALSHRLAELTGGHAIFVTLCLDEWSPGQGADVALPPTLSRVVEERLRNLTEQDRALLVTGAAQGDVFLSGTVAAVTGMSHDVVVERLRLIARDHRLVVPEEPPAWARWEAADCYRFEHRALWSVVYAQQSAEQMRSRHARIAAALGRARPEGSSLERRLEIARHLRQGGPACLAASADAHFVLARDAATEGLSLAEAERHCGEVIKATRELPAGTEGRDRRFVQAVELLLSLTEVRWRGPRPRPRIWPYGSTTSGPDGSRS